MFTDLYPFTSHFFTQPAPDGGAALRQHYIDEGAGEPIVMVHGNPTWSFFFRGLITRFSAAARVIAPDHIGMGFSDKPQDYPYNLAGHIANLTRLLDSLIPAEQQVTLIVHDWGGAIGMGWAVAHPERVKKIVVMNTAAFLFPRIPLALSLCRIPGLGVLMVRGLNAFARAATTTTTVKGLTPEIKAGYLKPYGSWAERVAVLRFVEDVPMSAGHPTYAVLQNIDAGLQKLAKVPLLIQWGGQDWCFHDGIYAEWLRRFPNAETDYYGNAGHYLLEDAGEEIAARIAKFLQAPENPTPEAKQRCGTKDAIFPQLSADS